MNGVASVFENAIQIIVQIRLCMSGNESAGFTPARRSLGGVALSQWPSGGYGSA